METGWVFLGTHPAPNGTGFKFNKRVWEGYEIFFLNRGWVRVLPHPAPPRPAPFIYKINFKIKLNLNFKINLI